MCFCWAALALFVGSLCGCRFEQTLEEPISSSDGGSARESDASAPFVCPRVVEGTAQDTPLDAELIVAWERSDSRFVIDHSVVSFVGSDRRTFVANMEAAPSEEAWIETADGSVAIGRIYALDRASILDGPTDRSMFLRAISGGTYRDALVWRAAGQSSAHTTGTWLDRAPEGYSAWRCADSPDKTQAFRESTCAAFVLESAGDPGGDRHCDWH